MTKYFPPRSLVRVRGREWIILPSEDDELLRLLLFTGAEVDALGIFMPLEGDGVR